MLRRTIYKVFNRGITPLAYIVIIQMMVTAVMVSSPRLAERVPLMLSPDLESLMNRLVYGTALFWTCAALLVGFKMESVFLAKAASAVGFVLHLYALILYILEGYVFGITYVLSMTLACAYFYIAVKSRKLWFYAPTRTPEEELRMNNPDDPMLD